MQCFIGGQAYNYINDVMKNEVTRMSPGCIYRCDRYIRCTLVIINAHPIYCKCYD